MTSEQCVARAIDLLKRAEISAVNGNQENANSLVRIAKVYLKIAKVKGE